MGDGNRFPRRSGSLKYALIGGAISIPLTIVVHMKTGSGIEFSSGTMVVGGGIAGYLAKSRSIPARTTGVLAGAIGALPLLYWWSSVFGYIPFSLIPFWPDAALQIFYDLVSTLIILCGSLVAGWLGGRVSQKIQQSQIASTQS